MSDRVSSNGQQWIPIKNLAITRQKQCRQLKAAQSSVPEKKMAGRFRKCLVHAQDARDVNAEVMSLQNRVAASRCV